MSAAQIATAAEGDPCKPVESLVHGPAHPAFDAAKTSSDPYDERPGPWYDMKRVREIERETGIVFGLCSAPAKSESASYLADSRPGKGLTRPGPSRAGKEPCGECRLRPGETCDICDAREPVADAPTAKGPKAETDFRTLATSLVDEINDLINESGGVWGLHLNGDDATWADITVGGRFERLPSLHDLREALATNPTSAGKGELREALQQIKNTGRSARMGGARTEQEWKNTVVRMEREAEAALARPAAPAVDGPAERDRIAAILRERLELH